MLYALPMPNKTTFKNAQPFLHIMLWFTTPAGCNSDRVTQCSQAHPELSFPRAQTHRAYSPGAITITQLSSHLASLWLSLSRDYQRSGSRLERTFPCTQCLQPVPSCHYLFCFPSDCCLTRNHLCSGPHFGRVSPYVLVHLSCVIM